MEPPRNQTTTTTTRVDRFDRLQPGDPHPTKVKLGKVNCGRDVGIPLAALVFGILFCWGISDIGSQVTEKQPDKLSLIEQLLTRQAQQSLEKRGGPSALNCALYVSTSSLPGGSFASNKMGYSVFAGKNYTEGENVVLPGVLSSHHLLSFPVFVKEQQQPRLLHIHPYAFLVKHHPSQSNIDGTTFYLEEQQQQQQQQQPNDDDKNIMDGEEQPQQQSHRKLILRATRPIQEGDELFLPYESHPHSQQFQVGGVATSIIGEGGADKETEDWESSTTTTTATADSSSSLLRLLFDEKVMLLPQPKDYQLAQEIVNDMIQKFQWKGKKGREMNKGNHIEETIKLLHKTVQRFDPIVANFLPTTKREMDAWIGWKSSLSSSSKEGGGPLSWSSSFDALVLNRKSVYGLQMNGKCLSYTMSVPSSSSLSSLSQPPKQEQEQESTKVTTTTSSSSNNRIIVKQKLKKGAIVIPIPMLILPTAATTTTTAPTVGSSSSSTTTGGEGGSDQQDDDTCTLDAATASLDKEEEEGEDLQEEGTRVGGEECQQRHQEPSTRSSSDLRYQSCLVKPNIIPLILCPLTLPEWMTPPSSPPPPPVETETDNNKSDPKEQQQLLPKPEPNVEYRWGIGGGSHHNEKIQTMTIKEVLEQQYTTQLSLDLIALRDLEPGETLQVQNSIEELLPEIWKKQADVQE